MKSKTKKNNDDSPLKPLYNQKQYLLNEIEIFEIGILSGEYDLKDLDKYLKLNSDYNNLCYRIDTEEEFLLPVKSKRIAPKTYSREAKIQTKRCG